VKAPGPAHLADEIPEVRENSSAGELAANRAQSSVMSPPGKRPCERNHSSGGSCARGRDVSRTASAAARGASGRRPNTPYSFPPVRTGRQKTPQRPETGMRRRPGEGDESSPSSTSVVLSWNTSLEAENPRGSATWRSIPRGSSGPKRSHGRQTPRSGASTAAARAGNPTPERPVPASPAAGSPGLETGPAPHPRTARRSPSRTKQRARASAGQSYSRVTWIPSAPAERQRPNSRQRRATRRAHAGGIRDERACRLLDHGPDSRYYT
jgi:hypothetical protein